jgi:hypothetical protein
MTTNRSSLSKDAALASSASISSSSMTTPLLQKSSAIDIGEDTDENKYKRRSALTWFARWWRNFVSPHLRSRSRGNKKQQLLIAFLVLFGLVTLLVIFHYFGRSGGEEDYRGDPMLIPIRMFGLFIGSNMGSPR